MQSFKSEARNYCSGCKLPRPNTEIAILNELWMQSFKSEPQIAVLNGQLCINIGSN